MNEYVLFIGALILLSLDIQDNFQFQISNFFFLVHFQVVFCMLSFNVYFETGLKDFLLNQL